MKLKAALSPMIVLPASFLLLIAAGIILPCVEWGKSESARVVLFVLVMGWLAVIATSLCTYFYGSWKRVNSVPNRAAYVAWLTFQTACGLGIIGFVASVMSSDVTSARRARERVLQQDLLVMRSVINQYTIDKQKPLRSLGELVDAGYLRSVPVDPSTGRNDTWVVKCSANGVIDVESGYGMKAKARSTCE